MPATLEPAFVGELFTCYHPARPPARAAAVICPPVGHEYVRCHRPLRLLADRLAGAGCAVLRWDPYGVGDSAGEHHQATLDRWTRGVREAADHLAARTGLSIGLVGLRLGATLAALAAADMPPARRIVLWDPIIDGAAHWQALRRAHADAARWIEQEFGPPPRDDPGGDPGGEEVLGSSWGPQLVREMQAVDLTRLETPPAREALILGADHAPLADRLRRLGVRVDVQAIDAERVAMSEPHLAVMPVRTIGRIVEWLTAKGEARDD